MSAVNIRMTKDVPEARERPYNEAGYCICPEVLVYYSPGGRGGVGGFYSHGIRKDRGEVTH